MTPESRVVMELSSSCRDDCSEVTEEASEEVIVNGWCVTEMLQRRGNAVVVYMIASEQIGKAATA